MTIILITAAFALLLAFALGLALGFFKRVFAVKENPLAASLRALLPGANCGACGFPGCDGYAAALAAGSAEANKCSVGGQAVAEQLGALLGVDAAVIPMVSLVACRGFRDKALPRGEYTGVRSCRAAKISCGGTKLCSWGCAGFGDCIKVCPFDAIAMGPEGVPVIDPAKCTGCKKCASECPQFLIRTISRGQKIAMPLCSNRNPVRAQVARYCKSGCIKCEMCVKNCPQKCITMQNGIPAIDPKGCTACGVCVGKCPTKVLALTGA
ncbi:MAG: RnfABCDGE type electron transport complex subunit B [Treponema sp.]|jgi:Na+-translocating ferredoxin:NAD+ oxidoreductase RNF subunit RnfB|nr:RnfABCDGE type electron transport complex subunit B [Treponema sp.]